MRRSSKVILVLSFLLAALLVSIYAPLIHESQPDFTQQDAHEMLGGLAAALDAENTNKVVSFAAPDADIAGRNVKTIRDYLRRGFGFARNLSVTFNDVRYARQGETVELDTRVKACEKGPGAADCTEVYYDQEAHFTLRRRATPQLCGLFTTYEWRITRVTAPDLPDETQIL
jgi:hypothetical protein